MKEAKTFNKVNNCGGVIDISKIDPDRLSKRTILGIYSRMRTELAAVTIRLFFYAPEDEYFKNLSDEERQNLIKAAARLYNIEGDENDKTQ